MKKYRFYNKTRIILKVYIFISIVILKTILDACFNVMPWIFLSLNMFNIIIGVLIFYKVNIENVRLNQDKLRIKKTVEYKNIISIKIGEKVNFICKKNNGQKVLSLRLIDLKHNFEKYKLLLDDILSNHNKTRIEKFTKKPIEIIEEVQIYRHEKLNRTNKGKTILGGGMIVICIYFALQILIQMLDIRAIWISNSSIDIFIYLSILIIIINVVSLLLVNRRSRKLVKAQFAYLSLVVIYAILICIFNINNIEIATQKAYEIGKCILEIARLSALFMIVYEYLTKSDRAIYTLKN